MLAFRADSKTLAAAGWKEVKVWDVAGGKLLSSFRRTVWARSGAFSSDLKTLASSNYHEIDLWDVAAGKERLILSEHRGSVRAVAFSDDDKVLAAASLRKDNDGRSIGQVKLWDVTTGREQATLRGEFSEVPQLALAPGGKTLVLLEEKGRDEDTELRWLELTTGRTLFSHRSRSLMSVSFAPDGTLRVLGRPDAQTVKLWEVAPPKEGR